MTVAAVLSVCAAGLTSPQQSQSGSTFHFAEIALTQELNFRKQSFINNKGARVALHFTRIEVHCCGGAVCYHRHALSEISYCPLLTTSDNLSKLARFNCLTLSQIAVIDRALHKVFAYAFNSDNRPMFVLMYIYNAKWLTVDFQECDFAVRDRVK
jgi:hypothetical protein